MATTRRDSRAAFLTTVCLAAALARPAAADALREGFLTPPDEAKPRTWWHWVSGNVSKEGITLDLEAMKRVGIAEAQVFNVDQGPAGPVRTLSPQWDQLTAHAIREADRIGIELAFQNCPGWSTSGGPWVTPARSMQFVYWSTTAVAGGRDVSVRLPKGKDAAEYVDIAVLAFATPRGDAPNRPAAVTASAGVRDAGALIDADPATGAALAWPADGGPAHAQFDFDAPAEFGSVTLRFDNAPDRPRGEIQAGDDERTFRAVAPFDGDGPVAFAPTAARHWRVVVRKPGGRADDVRLAGVAWGGARLADARAKAGFEADLRSRLATPWAVPAGMGVAADQLIDLTPKMAADGTLTWAAPPGDWTVLRIGHASTGRTNHPSVPEATGLEADKLSVAAMTAHFNDGLMGRVLADAGPLAGKSLKYVLCDSWESGTLNWTPGLRDAFEKRCGYDPVPWLPAMTGRVVGSVDASERFLWDLRRVIADLTADNHFGTLQKLAHEHGLQFYAEAPGLSLPCVADALQCKARTDIPMGEFWLHGIGSADVKEAASAAHTNGKRWVAAEAFTAQPEQAGWKNDPYGLKALGDKHFCLGLNRIVFHRYAHQPSADRVPGVTMGPWGLNFERTQTWWEPGAAWLTYLARCQWMLSQGRPVGDVLFFYGEDAPNTLPARAELRPLVPDGYDYDGCDAETLAKATVRDGRIELPGGASYRVLALRESDRMTPRTLGAIARLADAGATVAGVRPTRSPSLAGYPHADDEVRRLADDVWGSPAATRPAGRASAGPDVAVALRGLGLAPDFSTDAKSPAAVMAVHRRAGTDDVYFVSNQRHRPARVSCAFRVAGKAPELWHPDTGVTEPVPAYREADGVTTVPLFLPPAGSVFVVFRDTPRPADRVTQMHAPRDADTPAVQNVQVDRAVYGPVGGPGGADVTERLARTWADDAEPLRVENGSMGGDPTPNVVKALVVDYRLDGTPVHAVVPEGDLLALPARAWSTPGVELRRDEAGRLKVRAWSAGDVALTFASGKTWRRTITTDAPVSTVDGAWDVDFPPDRGAPPTATFPALTSWTTHADAGVRHFSGTATYRKTVPLDAGLLGTNRAVELDLGEVKNLARVRLNGHDLGVLWKPPFRVDVGRVARPGENRLEVEITNLWPNRLIGDASLPADKRVTWTTYDPFKADTPLLPSGLLGPVTVRSTEEISVDP